MEAKVAIIATYPALRQLAEAVIHELGLPVAVFDGDIDEGVYAAQQAVSAGAEVIISRGGTANLIRQKVVVPVVDIEVSAFDIIRCLFELKEYKGQVGVVGFSNIVYGCEALGTFVGIDLKEIVVESMDDVPVKIQLAAQDGLQLIIGDVISVHCAREIGLDSRLIVSGKEAVAKAIYTAMAIAEVRVREREQHELLRMVVNNSSDGIIAVNSQSYITLFNPVAEKTYGVKAAEAVGSKLGERIQFPSMENTLRTGIIYHNDLKQVGTKTIVIQRDPIRVKDTIVGAIASFRDVTEVQRLEQAVRKKLHSKGLIANNTLDDIIGDSDAVKQLKIKCRKYGTVDSTVLIAGESGTGKELVAQGIHNCSKRAKGPFVAVNCAALPASLLESELFGYEEGAFTGAKRGGKPGLFELAHGGTIFLDEIGEMPVQIQATLLRVIQERSVLRVGGTGLLPVDVRIIAATNRNVFELIKQGKFREDLFYRINTLTVTIPPLRQRRNDIPLLAANFLQRFAALNPQVTTMSSGASRALQNYSWPGNIRELMHLMERVVLLCEGRKIDGEIVNQAISENSQWKQSKDLLEAEQDHISQLIVDTMEEENQNRTKAAKRLGISRSTLWRRLKALEERE